MKRSQISRIIRESLEYRRAHQSVNPNMLKALSDSGIRNYSLFLRPDGLLVGYFEAENPKESLRKLGETEANRGLSPVKQSLHSTRVAPVATHLQVYSSPTY